MKKQLRFPALLLALILLLSSLASCGLLEPEPLPNAVIEDPPSQEEPSQEEPPQQQEEEDDEPYTIVITLKNVNAVQHTEAQQEYLDDENYNSLPDGTIKGTKENSRPLSVKLQWSAATSNGKKKKLTLTYTVLLSENSNLSDASRTPASGTTATVKNLKVGTIYYWAVEGVMNGETYISETGSFTTADSAPRNLEVDGITNCRDLGGWKTLDGGTVKQGMVFRTAALNTRASQSLNISASGLEFLRELGIKTEIDLRMTTEGTDGKIEQGGLTESAIGKDVNYVTCPMDYLHGNVLTYNTKMVVKVFEIFGNEDNYPILFHCSIGTDRTGMIAFLINGLLGVSEEDLYRDYLFSNFGNIGSSRNSGAITSYIEVVSKAGGDTLAEQIENYLKGIGVKQSDIDTVKRMMK